MYGKVEVLLPSRRSVKRMSHWRLVIESYDVVLVKDRTKQKQKEKLKKQKKGRKKT